MYISMIRFAVISSLLPIVAAMILGEGLLTQPAIFLFLGLAYITPAILGQRGILMEKGSFPFHKGLLFYSWAFWSIFFLLGTITINLQLDLSNLPMLFVGEVVALLLFIFLEMGTMACLAKWFEKKPRNAWVQWLDLCIFILPIPMVILGDLLYQNGPQLLMATFVTFLFNMLVYNIYFLVIMAMATFAIYLYPKYDNHYKGIRLVRIVLTAAIWVGANMVALYSNFSGAILSKIFYLLPIFTGSPLVFITPTVCEMIIIGFAFYVGLRVEQIFINFRTKK